jgi:hypothetical protein
MNSVEIKSLAQPNKIFGGASGGIVVELLRDANKELYWVE